LRTNPLRGHYLIVCKGTKEKNRFSREVGRKEETLKYPEDVSVTSKDK